MTKRRADQSQLDWLWDTYGEKEISSDPSFADNGDILDKKGVSVLVQKMIGSVLASLEIQESSVNDEKLDIIGVTHNGVKNTMFSIDKEDHLVKVVVRMSSQADIDAGNAEHINKPFVELDMFSGKAFGFCLENMVLTGANTSTITTLVQGGYINCELIIAENNDKAITCKATNNGLYVGLNLAQKEGQVGLEKVDNGLVVRLKWGDNKDIMFKEMTWAKQSVDTGNNGNTDGIIYFISDKGYILLNGIKYGALSEDAVRYTSINEGENKTIHLDENDSISSGKSDSIVNLIKMNNGAIIVGDANIPLRLFGSNEHVRFNGKKLAYLDEFNKEQDRVNVELGKLDSKIDGAVQTMTELINTFTESIDKEIDEEIKPSIEKLETLAADLNTSILNHIKNTDEQFAKVKEETDRLQKADETLNNNMVEGFDTINKNVSDGFNTINGAIDNELRPNIKKNAEDIKTTNETLAIVNQNLADSVAKINEAFTTGFNTINGAINDEIRPNIEKNKDAISTEADERKMADKQLGSRIDQETEMRVMMDEAISDKVAEVEATANNSVQWTDVATGDNPGRKSILLENHDTILGKGTEGNAYNIVMISKWNKVDLGTAQLPFNMNGSEERPTYNDDKELALMDDVNAIEIPTTLPNPNALTIRYNGVDAFSYDGSKAETGNFIVNAKTIPIEEGETETIADRIADMDANISRLVYGDVDVQKYLSDANYTAQMLFKLEQSYLDDLGNPENVNGRPYSEENKPAIGHPYIVYAKFDESFVFHYDMYEINANSSFMLKTLFDCMNSYNTEMDMRISKIEKDVAALKGGN